MTNRERIKVMIASRRSHNPISEHALAWQLGITGRSVQKEVKALIEEDGEPIATSTRPPYGYYRPVTQEEIDDCVRSLKSRLGSTARRLRAFEQASGEAILGILDEQNEQGGLGL